MKKILALLLAATLAVSCTILSYAADDMPEPIFDMTISKDGTGAVVVTNGASSDKIGTITYGLADNSKNKPTYGETETENEIPYLIFNANGETAAAGTALANRAVNVSITDTAVYDANAMTISAWIYADNVDSNDHIFAFGKAGSTTEWGYSLLYNGATGLQVGFDADGEKAPSPLCSIENPDLSAPKAVWSADNNNSWRHVTLTRTWTQTEPATESTGEKGYYTANLYINGKWAGSCSEEDAIRQTYADAFDEGSIKLAIGNCAGGSGYAFGGKIADFKLWTNALTAEQIKSDFLTTSANYFTAVGATHSLASLGRGDAEFKITFDGDIDSKTLENGVEVKDAEGRVIETKYKSYDEEKKEATFSIFEYLEAGATYTLHLTDVMDANGCEVSLEGATFTAKDESEATITASPIAYKDDDGNPVSAALATAADISATVTNTSSETLKYFLSLSIKDTEGGAYKMDVSSPLTLTAGASDALTLNATGLIPGGSVVTRIWCMTESGKFYPLETPAELQ